MLRLSGCGLPMTRAISLAAWLVAIAYFGLLAAANVVIATELHRPPEGPWPGWAPLVEADFLYGGLGMLAIVAVRLLWRRTRLDGSSGRGVRLALRRR